MSKKLGLFNRKDGRKLTKVQKFIIDTLFKIKYLFIRIIISIISVGVIGLIWFGVNVILKLFKLI